MDFAVLNSILKINNKILFSCLSKFRLSHFWEVFFFILWSSILTKELNCISIEFFMSSTITYLIKSFISFQFFWYFTTIWLEALVSIRLVLLIIFVKAFVKTITSPLKESRILLYFNIFLSEYNFIKGNFTSFGTFIIDLFVNWFKKTNNVMFTVSNVICFRRRGIYIKLDKPSGTRFVARIFSHFKYINDKIKLWSVFKIKVFT